MSISRSDNKGVGRSLVTRRRMRPVTRPHLTRSEGPLSRSRRGQFSFEFIMLIGFFFIVFAGVMLVAQQRSTEIVKQSATTAAADIANIMTREIRYAYIGGEGYTRTFGIPRTLMGVNYSIMVLNYTSESAGGLQAGPQAALLFINASNLPAPSTLPLPYKVELRYADRDDAGLRHNGFKVTLEVPLWTKP